MKFFKAIFRKQSPRWTFSSLSNESSDDFRACEKFLDSPDRERASSEDARFLPDSEGLLSISAQRRIGQPYWALAVITSVNAIMFCSSVVIFFKYLAYNADGNACVRATSAYSPIIESSHIKVQDVAFNGTLWPPVEEPWSRREFGDPQAEEMWESFEPVDTFPITRKDVIAMGKDPETVAKYPNDYWGMGEDAYIASLDTQHKIHCLNELRKMTFNNYGREKPSNETHSQLWWIHLRHCTDMLAQDLICHADADLVTYRWMDTQDNPFPDFSVNRKCKSLDTLLKYRDEHKVDMKKYIAMTKPKVGIKQVPNEPGYYAMFGFRFSKIFPNGEGHAPLPDPTKWFGVPYEFPSYVHTAPNKTTTWDHNPEAPSTG